MFSGNFAAERLDGVVVIGALLDPARVLVKERIILLDLKPPTFQVFLAMNTQASHSFQCLLLRFFSLLDEDDIYSCVVLTRLPTVPCNGYMQASHIFLCFLPQS